MATVVTISGSHFGGHRRVTGLGPSRVAMAAPFTATQGARQPKRVLGGVAVGILFGAVIAGVMGAMEGRGAGPVVIAGLFAGVMLMGGLERQSNPGASGRSYWPGSF